jgi:hypothetical protein
MLQASLRAFPRFLGLASALVVAAVLLLPGSAAAQDDPEVRLTEKQVQSFIAAQPEIVALEGKFDATEGDQINPKLLAALEDIAKKHGFADLDEMDDVGFAISWVLSGIDPDTKRYSEAYIAGSIKKQIEDVRADKAIPEKDKQEILKELNEALKTIEPVKDRNNIELVEKYYDQLEAFSQ